MDRLRIIIRGDSATFSPLTSPEAKGRKAGLCGKSLTHTASGPIAHAGGCQLHTESKMTWGYPSNHYAKSATERVKRGQNQPFLDGLVELNRR